MRKFKCIKSDKSKHEGDRKEYFVVGNIYNEGKSGGVVSESGYEFTDSEDIIKWLGDCCGYYLEEIFDEEIKEDKKMSKFKVGDMVKIISNSCGHCFKIGDVVELYEDCGGNFRGRTSKNEYKANHILEDDMEKFIKPTLDNDTMIEKLDGEYCSGRLCGDCIFSGNDCGWSDMTDEELLSAYNLAFGDKSIESSTTFTITTSPSTTTLTDGAHITSINRYYTDKHNDMVALEEVVKKYKSEIDETERKSKEKHLFDDETNCDYGVIGTLTILTDSVGRKLFVGDVVKVYNKDGSDDGFIDLVCHDNEDGDFIMGCACATRNNSKKEYNYLKEMSYEDISNYNKIWDSCLVIK